MNPTGRFADRAADYAAARPAYPDESIDAVIEGLGAPASIVAADVGAGTGISARLLSARGVRVIAVEPNEAMRQTGMEESGEGVEWAAGTAERTGLADGSVDLVLAAQAFHWFHPHDALAEFHRILRPGGRLALMWNDRDNRDPLTAEYTRLIQSVAIGGPEVTLPVRVTHLEHCRRFSHLREHRSFSSQPLDEEGLVRRAMSSSYVPKSGPEAAALVDGLRAAFRRFADGPAGAVRLCYVTRTFLAERTG